MSNHYEKAEELLYMLMENIPNKKIKLNKNMIEEFIKYDVVQVLSYIYQISNNEERKKILDSVDKVYRFRAPVESLSILVVPPMQLYASILYAYNEYDVKLGSDKISGLVYKCVKAFLIGLVYDDTQIKVDARALLLSAYFQRVENFLQSRGIDVDSFVNCDFPEFEKLRNEYRNETMLNGSVLIPEGIEKEDFEYTYFQIKDFIESTKIDEFVNDLNIDFSESDYGDLSGELHEVYIMGLVLKYETKLVKMGHSKEGMWFF